MFQGRQITDKRVASRAPAGVLTFGDAWWDLERLVFQQQWKTWNPTSSAAIVQPLASLNLFQDFTTGYYLTNGAQIEEVLNWAIASGVNVQIGTVDLAWYIQPYPATALSCASAIQVCLKPTPGACCYIDMSTTPPTFNCRERYYHTALSLPYASGSHRSSELVPRYDMQAPQVVFQYSQTVDITVGDQHQVWNNIYWDAWPLDSTLPFAKQGGKQVGAIVTPIKLADWRQVNLMQTVVGGAFANPPPLDWWKGKKPAMAGYTDLAYVAGSFKILDPNGNDITTTILASYPNELVGGAVASWMKDGTGTQIGKQDVTVQGAFTYSEKDPRGRVWHTVGPANPHVVSVNTRLTNSAIGEVPYQVLQSLDTGQSPVANLAQYLWTLLSWLFWDGSHDMVEADGQGAPAVGTIVDCRYAINLTGGATDWAGMLSPVHAVDIDFTRGKTAIQFGLPKRVGPSELEELCQFFKWRVILSNPQLRSAGNLGPVTGEVVGTTPRENTSNSAEPPQLHTVMFPAGVRYGAVYLHLSDAENECTRDQAGG